MVRLDRRVRRGEFGSLPNRDLVRFKGGVPTRGKCFSRGFTVMGPPGPAGAFSSPPSLSPFSGTKPGSIGASESKSSVSECTSENRRAARAEESSSEETERSDPSSERPERSDRSEPPSPRSSSETASCASAGAASRLRRRSDSERPASSSDPAERFLASAEGTEGDAKATLAPSAPSAAPSETRRLVGILSALPNATASSGGAAAFSFVEGPAASSSSSVSSPSWNGRGTSSVARNIPQLVACSFSTRK
mmetsp:Transcript_8378/g.35002  ORF Transcript_8378/g.35002 Transcript_8378/m.35002 type:complete len:250 (-) Transcript_8378:1939-2688(-)